MNIGDFYNLVVVVKCPKCGEDPNNMQIRSVVDVLLSSLNRDFTKQKTPQTIL